MTSASSMHEDASHSCAVEELREAWGNKGGLSCVQDRGTHESMCLIHVDVCVKNHHRNTQ